MLDTIFYRRLFDKMLTLYTSKKRGLGGDGEAVLDDLFGESGREWGKFAQIDNFVVRNSYTEVFQFFAPHIFFNLACWGMAKLNRLMSDIKHEIEQLSPSEYRMRKDENLEAILRKHRAWDAGLSAQANLELLDVIAFALANFYQEYRNRLFFAEDVLRKQYQEMEILERSEARKNFESKRKFWDKQGGKNREKTKFELMAEEMGIFLEPLDAPVPRNSGESEQDLFLLKEYLKENGIGGEYLNKIREFSEAQRKIEQKTDANFQENQSEFGKKSREFN